MFRRRRRDNRNEEPAPSEETYGPPDADLVAEDYDDAGGPYASDEKASEYDAELDDDELTYTDPDYTGDLEGAEQGQAGGFHATTRAPGQHRAERADLSDPATWTRMRDDQSVDRAAATTAGPWDSGSGYPDRARVDFGSLLVPVEEGYEIQAMMSEEEGISVAVVRGDSAIQLQPFAAPRNSGLWTEVLPEIAQEVDKAGGQSAERAGPFGPELVARVIPQGAGTAMPPQPLRFIGVDGPRWFLRGLISGPAAMDDDLTEQFRAILADVVVVRGEHALPPRQPLQIQLPEEARQAAEEGQPPDQQPSPFDPYERGPEITETR